MGRRATLRRSLAALIMMGMLAVLAQAACDREPASTGDEWAVGPTPRAATTVSASPTPSHPGQANYVTHCASCHGVSGEGQPNWFTRGPDGLLPAPPHDNYGHTWHHGDGYLFQVTKRGGLAFVMPGQPSGMPGFDLAMTDAEIIEVLEYIKGFWGADEREFQRSASVGDPYPR